MRVDKLLRWKFLGQVAEQVEEYDSSVDAIGMPLFSGSMAFACAYTAVSISGGGGIPQVMGFALGAFGSILGYATLVSCIASVVYARQETELPANYRRVED